VVPANSDLIDKLRVVLSSSILASPLWGAPRIHSEPFKLGIEVGETSVSKYMVRHRRLPSQAWRTFLDNHLIGTIRRECLGHVIVFNETSLRRTLAVYLGYYHKSRTHLVLSKDAPDPRPETRSELRRAS